MINGFMKELIKQAHLNGNYTSHNIRSTCITTLDNSGFEARHITAISSHKSEATIKTYSTKCPEKKRKEMYDALNQSVIPKKRKVAETASKPPEKDDLPTINFEDVADLSGDLNKNNNNNEDFPPNFKLVPFETDQ